jgi:hypothetical protein
VIRQHLYLVRGGDRPDPALAARCEQIVSARPDMAEWRRQVLKDPWWRACGELAGATETVADQYDPEYLQHKVDYANKLDDPFSREAITTRLWCESFWPETPGRRPRATTSVRGSGRSAPAVAAGVSEGPAPWLCRQDHRQQGYSCPVLREFGAP